MLSEFVKDVRVEVGLELAKSQNVRLNRHRYLDKEVHFRVVESSIALQNAATSSSEDSMTMISSAYSSKTP
ncbi:hypothetical protein GGI13_001126 [Coemansia sp. RSA 455]|nr:hypothetical protein GGI13_001126 [Coemansia sp. RSA 455]